MGFFDKLSGKGHPLTVAAPFSGRAMRLEDIPDPVFSQGILGPGCGMDPGEETVHAPFDGTVTQVTDTMHALGLTSADGVEVLIHVGIDTVEMNGQGFACLVKEGDAVQAGQRLLTFTRAAIEAAGHAPITAIVVTNAGDFAGVELAAQGALERGGALLTVRRK